MTLRFKSHRLESRGLLEEEKDVGLPHETDNTSIPTTNHGHLVWPVDFKGSGEADGLSIADYFKKEDSHVNPLAVPFERSMLVGAEKQQPGKAQELEKPSKERDLSQGIHYYDAIRSYFRWYILLPICLFGSVRMIRPHWAYIVPYLEDKQFASWDIEGYGTLCQYGVFFIGLFLVGAFALEFEYGVFVVIAVEILSHLASRLTMLYMTPPSKLLVNIAFATGGLGLAAEALLFLYRVHIVDDHFNQEMLSISSAAFSIAAFVSGAISRALLHFNYSLDVLFYVSIGALGLTALIALTLFPGLDRNLKYGFVNLHLTGWQLHTAEKAGYFGKHWWPALKEEKEKHIARCKTREKQEEDHPSAKENKRSESVGHDEWKIVSCCEKGKLVWHYVKNKNGFFWGLAWSLLNVFQWLIQAEIPMRWLDISHDTINNGLMDGLGYLGSAIGCLIPWFIEHRLSESFQVPFCMLGLLVICGELAALTYCNHLFTSYAVFIAYQLSVSWMVAFVGSMVTKKLRSDDPEGQTSFYILMAVLFLIAAGLQMPVRMFASVQQSQHRFALYMFAFAGITTVCLLLAIWNYVSNMCGQPNAVDEKPLLEEE